MMDYTCSFDSIAVYPHHIKQNICGTRAKYRDGRKDTAVKVYTVNQESIYLLISNVPALGGGEDLRALCDQYGEVVDFRPLDDYPCEAFTEAYLAKYICIAAARAGKRHLDDKPFLGSTLHVCYAPEFETVTDTQSKLSDRRKYVAWKTNTGKKQPDPQAKTSQRPSSSLTSTVSNQQQPQTYIWAGKEYTICPPATAPAEQVPKRTKTSLTSFVPRQIQSPSDPHSAGSIPPTHRGLSYPSRSNSQTHVPTVGDSSYQSTISSVREKISRVSVPNVRVSLKRKKRI